MHVAENGISELHKVRCSSSRTRTCSGGDETGFADAFAMADQVLYSGVACITD